MTKPTRRTFPIAVMVAGMLLCSSCQRTAPAAKRYAFTGRVASIDSQSQTAIIAGDEVPGFMDAMAMSYRIKPESTLEHLTPGDSISAEVVVVAPNSDDAAPDYWLENVKVTGHVVPRAAASSPQFPTPGEEVPDFSFTNESGRRISFHDYRGQVLLLTFIYTRCPFPDFCPRMSSKFEEIYRQLGRNPALAGARLLSISIDPEHDTPKVLRDYAFAVAHTHDRALFSRWEFAAASAADLPKIADFFALTVKPEGGLITHTLSTAVIGPDGKVAKWYHGGDWQVSDLIKDATAAEVPEEKSPSLIQRSR